MRAKTVALAMTCQGDDAHLCRGVSDASAGDDASACLVLGTIAEANDLGFHLAADGHERACSLGSREGCVALARLLMVGGERLARDEERAYELLDEACGAGSDEACNLLGEF